MKTILAAMILLCQSMASAAEVPAVFAERQSGALFTVSDGESVYWTNNRSGEIMMKAGNSRGQPRALAKGSGPRRIRVVDGWVYWADTNSGSILSVSNKGGAVKPLAHGQNKPMGLFVSKTHVYWTNAGEGRDDGSVMRVSRTGGVPEVLAANQPMPMGLSVVGDAVFWSNVQDENKGQILSLSLKSKSVRIVAQAWSTSLAEDASHIYWIDAVRGSIVGLRLTDSRQAVLAGKLQQPGSLFSDGEFVYWTDAGAGKGGGRIGRSSVQTARAEVIAGRLPNPFGISGDAQNLYWTDLDAQAVYTLKKKP